MRLFTLFTIISSLLFISCPDFEDGLESPNSLWSSLTGTWRLTSTYTINDEHFTASSCDQLTTISFRPLIESELSTSINSLNFIVGSYIEVENKNCEPQFLNLGSIIGQSNSLPATYDLKVNLNEDCFNCSYSDIQSIDVNTYQTDSELFSITSLDKNEMVIKFITNIYNRQFGNQVLLDTLEYTLNKSDEADIFTVSEFDINDYEIIEWYHFDENNECSTADAFIGEGGVDEKAVRFNNSSSYYDCIDYSLRTAMGEDNEVTISLWVNPIYVLFPKQIIYAKYNNSAGPFILSLEYDKVVLEMNDSSTDNDLQRFTSFGTINANEWTHISLSYQEEDLLLCINGEIDQRESIDSWLYDADGDIMLANSGYALENDLEQGLIGQIDEFIIFKNYLNQDAMYQLYQWHLNN